MCIWPNCGVNTAKLFLTFHVFLFIHFWLNIQFWLSNYNKLLQSIEAILGFFNRPWPRDPLKYFTLIEIALKKLTLNSCLKHPPPPPPAPVCPITSHFCLNRPLAPAFKVSVICASPLMCFTKKFIFGF